MKKPILFLLTLFCTIQVSSLSFAQTNGWYKAKQIGNKTLVIKEPGMEPYYLGGYYLMKPKPIDFGADKEKIALTCSGCINTLVFDYWCMTSGGPDEQEQLLLGLNKEKITSIKNWTNEKYINGTIKYGNTFPDLQTAKTFKKLFFSELNDVNIYAIYLSETDTNRSIENFATEPNNQGDCGLRHNLEKRIEENINESEEFVGYDFIGIEGDGGFHSFYCHDINNDLISRFSLKINRYGLFDKIEDATAIKAYLNNPAAPVEPVPWYIAKTKRLKNTSSQH